MQKRIYTRCLLYQYIHERIRISVLRYAIQMKGLRRKERRYKTNSWYLEKNYFQQFLIFNIRKAVASTQLYFKISRIITILFVRQKLQNSFGFVAIKKLFQFNETAFLNNLIIASTDVSTFELIEFLVK